MEPALLARIADELGLEPALLADGEALLAAARSSLQRYHTLDLQLESAASVREVCEELGIDPTWPVAPSPARELREWATREGCSAAEIAATKEATGEYADRFGLERYSMLELVIAHQEGCSVDEVEFILKQVGDIQNARFDREDSAHGGNFRDSSGRHRADIWRKRMRDK